MSSDRGRDWPAGVGLLLTCLALPCCLISLVTVAIASWYYGRGVADEDSWALEREDWFGLVPAGVALVLLIAALVVRLAADAPEARSPRGDRFAEVAGIVRWYVAAGLVWSAAVGLVACVAGYVMDGVTDIVGYVIVFVLASLVIGVVGTAVSDLLD